MKVKQLVWWGIILLFCNGCGKIEYNHDDDYDAKLAKNGFMEIHLVCSNGGGWSPTDITIIVPINDKKAYTCANSVGMK